MPQIRHPLSGPIESVLLDASIFTSVKALRLLSRWGIGEANPPRLLVPHALIVAFEESRTVETSLPFWTFWGGRRNRPSPHGAAEVLSEMLRAEVLTPYHSESGGREATFDDFRRRLPPRAARDALTSRILYEELDYLMAHSILVGRSRRPYDALVEAGSVVVQVGERQLPPDAVEKLKKLGWKRIVTKVGIGLGASAATAVLPLLAPFVVGPVVTVIGLMDP